MKSESAGSMFRIFFSVDVVGSTAYKNKSFDNKEFQPWLQFFKDFFIDFPAKINQRLSIESMEPLTLWKGAGDELLFYKEIDSLQQLYSLIINFRDQVIEYRNKSFPQDVRKILNLKATVWGAGFPVINAVVPIDGKSDFIGPTVDTGFRIARFASPSRMIISAEIAYMLSCYIFNNEENPSLSIFFHGTEGLKGVLGGRPYPIFWIPVKDSLAEKENELLNIEPVSIETIKKYIEEFVSVIDDPFVMVTPYIVDNNGKEVFGKIPEAHREAIESMQKDPADNPVVDADNSDSGNEELPENTAIIVPKN